MTSSSSAFRSVLRGGTANANSLRGRSGSGSRRPLHASTTTTALFGLNKSGSSTASKKKMLSLSSDVIPGQGKGSPKWPVMWDRLTQEFGVKTVDASDLGSFLADGKATLVDVRQTIEYDEWQGLTKHNLQPTPIFFKAPKQPEPLRIIMQT
jgi:hypothetical protein